ncbi:TonB-dependent receptor [Silvibacterium sp.]|uniref:TonB-dependent receptor n=1 Tax=Silvibacterium sp. TaxID=1964179 RepID=UPI0039E6BDA1
MRQALLLLTFGLAACGMALAQAPLLPHGRVLDSSGDSIAGAEVRDKDHHLLAVSDADGNFSVPSGIHTLFVSEGGFATATVTNPTQVFLVTLTRLETVNVTAYRTPLPALDSPASVRVVSSAQLQQSSAPLLDGKLRQVPGFELFRRSSSLVANPTTEGVSLRGLGSTAASRSLVVFDDVPMNDPYGGWIHWDELPAPVIRSVEVVRGGASDLYGSSAIGGVVSLLPAQPPVNDGANFALDTNYGALETTDDSGIGAVRHGAWSALGAAGVIATDGYTLVAPNLRGAVDQPSNVHAQNGYLDLDRRLAGDDNHVFLRGNVLNEARHNGTPLTTNGNRLWRYAAGTDWHELSLRLFGDDEHYRQTFSSIATGRGSETLTRYAEDPAAELGAAAHVHHAFTPKLLVIAGADTHDVRASDDEILFTGSGGTLTTTGRQRQTGVYGEALATPGPWTLSGSARVDHFSNFDAEQFASATAPKTLPAFSETVFDPRLGLSRRIGPHFALSASAFRAYRAPTQNELYRTGQVGQQLTEPNANLRSERATGWETGAQAELPRLRSSVRVSWFWTQVNRPITALTLSTTPTLTTLIRENLGQIESRGLSADYALAPAPWISLEGGYQFAIATVTKYAQEPQLVGNWIPQVAREMATARLRLTSHRLGLLSLEERTSGRQFDDDANQYLLHPYFRFDAYATRSAGRHLDIYASGENLFDRSIEVGRTPILTLGTPRTAKIGLRLHWGE